MGIIQRQSIKRSIVQYTGILIGFLATIFVYSRHTELYGLAQFVLDGAALLSYFLMLGLNTVPVRFFPNFAQTYGSRSSFLTFLIAAGISGVVIGSLLLFLIKDLVRPILINQKDPLFAQFIYWSFPFAILLALKSLFSGHISNYKRIVMPGIIDNLFLKIALPVLILLTVYFHYSNAQFLTDLVICYGMVLIGLIIYLNSLDKIKLSPISRHISKSDILKIAEYSLFGLFGALGTFLALRIDTLFVAKYVNTEATGVYKIMGYFTSLIEVPYAAILTIAAPIVSSKIKEGDLSEVSSLFRRSSKVLLIVGGFIFLMVSLNAKDLFALLPFKETSDVSMAFFVILCLGGARLFDLATSVNSQIIIYSKYYRFNFYVIILLGILNVGLDFFLVPKFGLRGAAFATMTSILLFNLIKIIYIKYRFDLWPFTIETLNIIFLGFITFCIIFLLPFNFAPFTNIVAKCCGVILLFALPLYALGYLRDFVSGIQESISGFFK